MKNAGKITLGLLLTASVSAGVSYLTVQRAQTNGFGAPSTFGQNVHTVGLESLSGVETDFTVAAAKSIDAVVHIAAKSTRTYNQPTDIFEYFFGSNGQQVPRQQQQVGYGSGVIISSDGYIVTNNHVVNGADEIMVTLNERSEYPAKVIGTDENTDVALIKIEANNLPFVPFGNSDNLKVGEWVLAVGNPMNLGTTVTAGIVSAKARNLGIIDSEKNENQYQNNPFFQQQQQQQPAKSSKSLSIESFIQTDAAVNPGNSGGALVNLKGDLVGINTAIVSPTGTFAGYSFAIPVNIVAKVVNDLRKFGQVQRAMLGVTIMDINSETAKQRKIDVQEGVYVDGVADLSGAMEAGIKKGDIIKSIDGIKVRTSTELQAQVGLHHPSDVVEVSVLRDKEEKKIKVTLRNMQGGTENVKAAGIEALGAAFSEISPVLKRTLNIGSGVQVSGIKDGKFKLAGIRKGFIILKVNDTQIENVEQLEKVVNASKNNAGFDNGGLFIVGIYPDGKVRYYAVDLTEQ